MSIPVWFERELIPPADGNDVSIVRKMLGLDPNGIYDMTLVKAVSTFQKKHEIDVTGFVDEKTAVALGEREGHGLLPDWWPGHNVTPWDPEWKFVERVLGDTVSTEEMKRFQGNFKLKPSGFVDEDTAKLLYNFEV